MSSVVTASRKHPAYAFGITWLGQVISQLGSGLTTFALGVEVYRSSSTVTPYALLCLFYVLPPVLFSPLGGILADRWDRRRVMLLSDALAAVSPVWMLLLLWGQKDGHLAVAPWQFYAPIALASACDAFRWPAYQAATTLLVPKEQLGRASGLLDLGYGVAQIASPILAATLLLRIGLRWVILLDFASFAFAALTLLLVHFPQPPSSDVSCNAKGSFRRELGLGWEFVRTRRGLFGLLLFTTTVGLIMSLVLVLITPLTLSFTNVATVGEVQSIAGLGMLAGSILMTVWGGPRRRIAGVFGFTLLSGGVLLLAGLPPSVPLVAGASAIFLGSYPFVNGCAQAIWQTKVPMDVQGRVFAVRRILTGLSASAAMVLAGPLADKLFEPWLAPGGALATTVGRLIGTGPGRGIGFLFIVLGALSAGSVLCAYLSRSIRNIETELPDAIAPSSAHAQSTPRS